MCGVGNFTVVVGRYGRGIVLFVRREAAGAVCGLARGVGA